jgi:hypothetical protein
MTHPKIIAKKDRMCARFGHLTSKRFRTMLGALVCYCRRCGECYAPRALTTEGE